MNPEHSRLFPESQVYFVLKYKTDKMKKSFVLSCFALLLTAAVSYGQHGLHNGVSSVIINNFQQAFPGASDVEWEMDGELYKVEFETGWAGKDHDAWYDRTGKLVRHKEEITRSSLPRQVLATISRDYKGYRIDDVTKITEGNKITYIVELKTFTKEWKVTFDAAGTQLYRIAD